MEVFYTSPWVPPEWIKAHGLEPRGVWSAAEPAAVPLGAGVCAFAERVVGLAATHPDAAVIFSTHCDQLRRGFDTIASADSRRLFLFNLPATWQTEVAERLFSAELERLGHFLTRLGGKAPGAAQLAEVMAQYAQARGELLAAATRVPARQYAEAIRRFHWDGLVHLSENVPAPQEEAIPLAVVGGPMPVAHGQALGIIENAGGRVVLNASELGERTLVPAEGPPRAAATLPELRSWLARCFQESCVDVFQRPNTRLYSWLKERLAARAVRGIVLWHYVGCDLWRAEAQSLREAFGLPVLLLDSEGSAGEGARQAGRLEAFLEALR